MSDIEELKQSIIKSLDQAGEKALRMVQAIIQIDREYDFWDDLPEEIRNEVDEAIKEADKGGGISHEEMMKKYLK